MLAGLVLAALAITVDSAKAPAPPPPPRTIAELETRIRKILDSTHTPGIGLALVNRDTVFYANGLGLANVAAKRPATARTLFRIGSTSKSFAALTVLMLQEEGKLKLSDPIRQHIPEFWFRNPWEATDPVRIVNLLEHTTGFDDNSLRSYAHNDPHPIPLAQGLALDSATHVSRWRPGTRVSYCNTGPAIAAYIVEKLEGKPFERVVQERLFDPIGMGTATYFRPDTAKVPVATLYENDGRTENPYWNVFIRPAGAINASAEEMGRYVRFLLDRGAVNGRQLLPAAAIDRLERTESSLEAANGLPVGYGLHIARYADSAGFIWTGHDGGVNGGLTNLAYLPGAGLGYVFMINSGNGKAYGEIGRVVRDYLTRDLPKPALPARGAMPSVAAERYAGWYRPDNPRVQHLYFAERLLGLSRVAVTDTALFIKPLLGGGTLRYLPVRGLLFREWREPEPTLALVDDGKDGRPVAIEAMGYLLPTSLVRIPVITAWSEIGLGALWLLGLAITALVAAVGLLAGILRLLRRGHRAPSVTRPMWRLAIATLAAFVVGFGILFSLANGSSLSVGARSPTTVTAWLALLVFAALALVSVVAAFRRIAAAAMPRRFSLLTVRAVVLLNFVAASYLAYWGVIGWRTWR